MAENPTVNAVNDFKVSSSMFNRHSRVDHDTSLLAHRAPSAVKHGDLAAKKTFTALPHGLATVATGSANFYNQGTSTSWIGDC